MQTKISLFLISTVLAIVSCKKDAEVPIYADFPEPINKIIATKCATSGCHNQASYQAAAQLNLSSFANLFKGSSNGSSVIPFRSDFSSLCYFVNTYDDLGIKNTPSMPLNAKPLSREEVIAIKIWIDNGAPDKDGNIMWQDNPQRKKYYVANQGCDVVTVFDANTQLPMRYITVGKLPNTVELPHMVKVSPDGKYWYVVFVNANMLQKFSTADDKLVAEVDLGTNAGSPTNFWNTITISNDGKRAYCVSWQGSSRIASVNLEAMTLIQNIGGTNQAHGVALNNTQDTLFVTSQYGNFIYKIDTDLTSFTPITLDMSSVPSFVAGTLDPHQIIFSDDGTKYFVTCQAANQVRVMSTTTNQLLQIIPTGAFPLEMEKSSSQQKIYVVCEEEPSTFSTKQKGCVTVIDMNTYSKANYQVGYQPHGIAVDEANGLLVVASRNILVTGPTPHHTGNCGRNGFVNYFDLHTMQLLKKQTEVASDPYSVAIRP